ncbi:MAG: restriction endonuclease subunit S [Bacteroidetes bacterium]|jgi:type I restriction enzyme S subunit|nr:restriction endonuclease subunit S [Bacteroidota bacterium]
MIATALLYKETGFNWMPVIPENWELRRLKNVSKTISKGTTPSTIGSETAEEGTIIFLRAENLYENKITLTPTFYIDQETDQVLFRSRLETNDVLLVIAGATLGRTGIVTEEILPANTNQAVCFIRPDNIYPEFLRLWMQTNFITAEIWLNATQAALPYLAIGKIATFYILYPPIAEQKQIVSHIKTETTNKGTAIAKAEREIELIREYKEAMIAEVVMGRRNIVKE